MALVEARLRVRHPCPYAEFSSAFPSVELRLWSEAHRDVLLASVPDPAERPAVRLALKEGFRARLIVDEGVDTLFSISSRPPEPTASIPHLAERCGLWTLPPTQFSAGEETYRLLSSDSARLRTLTDRLRRTGEVELLSVRTGASLVPVRSGPSSEGQILEGLTGQQTRALLAALDHGLYEVPARQSWTTAARSLGIARSTFGEHLRKAARRVLRNAHPSLRLRLSEEGREPRPPLSEEGGALAPPVEAARNAVAATAPDLRNPTPGPGVSPWPADRDPLSPRGASLRGIVRRGALTPRARRTAD